MAAKILGVPIGFVKIKPSNSLTNPNAAGTGGSIGSELNCLVSNSNQTTYKIIHKSLLFVHTVFEA